MRIIMTVLIALTYTLSAQSNIEFSDSIQLLDVQYKKAKLKIVKKYLSSLEAEKASAMKDLNLKAANNIDSRIKKIHSNLKMVLLPPKELEQSVIVKKQEESKKPEPDLFSQALDLTGRWGIKVQLNKDGTADQIFQRKYTKSKLTWVYSPDSRILHIECPKAWYMDINVDTFGGFHKCGDLYPLTIKKIDRFPATELSAK